MTQQVGTLEQTLQQLRSQGGEHLLPLDSNEATQKLASRVELLQNKTTKDQAEIKRLLEQLGSLETLHQEVRGCIMGRPWGWYSTDRNRRTLYFDALILPSVELILS